MVVNLNCLKYVITSFLLEKLQNDNMLSIVYYLRRHPDIIHNNIKLLYQISLTFSVSIV